MRLLILFVCFSLFLECLSQDITEAGTQSSTEGTYTDNQGIDWDTTLSPSRTTVHGGRKGRYQPTSRTNLDYTTLFPNWGPMMMPIAAASPPFGTRIQNTNAKEETKDIQDVNSNIRHSENVRENLTENVNQYPAPSSAVRNPLNAPYHPYPPMLFYPRPNERLEDLRYTIPNESANSAYPLRLQDLNENQNGSASSPAHFYYGLPNLPSSRLDERAPFPFIGYPQPNFFLRNRADGRNFEGPVPFSPYAFPYGMYPPPPPPAAIPPNDDGSQIYPEIDVFVRPPYVDREPGSDPLTAEEVLARSDPSPPSEPIESPTNPPPVEPIPSESLPRSSVPINPFPFGFFPPGLAHPLPFPHSEIPPPTLPPQRFPETPEPRQENAPQNVLASAVPPNAFPPVVLPSALPPIVPPSALPPIVPPSALPPVVPPSALPPLAPAVAVDRLPENLPPPPSSSVDLPSPPEEAGAIPGIPAPPEALPPVITSDRTPYEFGFDMNDGKGTDQHRQESADEAGVVTGSYGYRDVYGVYRLVNYIADKNGFRAFVQSNEPGVANPGSADVVVMAERPPPKTVADSLKPPQPTAVEVPDDLLVQASESKA